ncbi:hypothetical protein F5I97DRAFT_1864020 [Phlebopus sp. FC_14]|nr:hypothetical protein F5I97DRAFT_1864020 [Phlebopus sp. FC_14]
MPPTATSATSREPHQRKKLVSNTQNGSQVMPEHTQTTGRRPPPPEKRQTTQEQAYTKKVPHRAGKPIINWFQRKLAGTVKTRRTLDGTAAVNGQQKVTIVSKSQLGHLAQPTSRSNGRSFSSPWPQSAPIPSQRQDVSNNKKTVPSTGSQRRTVSLNGGDVSHVFSRCDDEENVDTATHRSSLARDSMWSPASALEADEDASLRPLPPSAPPSPSLSHSSSSYLSHSQTFRSIAASTKPTTVLSIDLPPAGVGHIAQVPLTPVSQSVARPHARSSSTGTNGGIIGSGAPITFSALPPSPGSSPPPTSSMAPVNVGLAGPGSLVASMNGLQAPLHTAHHPRNNPRPSSPPLDNASVLTLASSAYAIPGARITMGSMGSATPSGLLGGGDSISHFGVSMLGDAEGENTSQFIIADDERLDERDADASLRALRPRSSRRCSWESEVSGWSARILGTGAGISTGSKSLWTSNSLKTGPLSLEDGDDDKAGASVEIAEVRTDNVKPASETEGRDTVPISDEADDKNQLEPSLSRIRDSGASVEDVPSTLGRSTGLAILNASLTDHGPKQ